MKVAILCLAMLFTLGADEVMRVESMVQDISNLRANYEQCQQELDAKKSEEIVPKIDIEKDKISTSQKVAQELKEYKDLLKQEQEKNRILSQKIEFNANEKSNSVQTNQKILELEKQLEETNKILKIKENELISLKKDFGKTAKNQTNEIKSLGNDKNVIVHKKEDGNKVCEDENKFPKLVMKTKKAKKTSKEESVQTIKAATFRLKKASAIYNAINGAKVYEWEKERTFTSNQKSQNWIKITGYFVNRVWQKAERDLWIEDSSVVEK